MGNHLNSADSYHSCSNGNNGLLPPGMLIDGRYQIKKMIGSGGFATVYLAHWAAKKIDVAVKVISRDCGEDDKAYVKRFLQEADITFHLHHPNIVMVYDYGVISETNQPYMVMELLTGHDLEQELKLLGTLPKERVFRLFRPVISALAQGHKNNIIHKDLKPANLFLVNPGTENEILKITDYGVARNNALENAKLTSNGQMMGTPRYLAPEYIRKQIVTPAIDVYQMALIISEVLSGKPAAPGSSADAIMRHSKGQLDIDAFLCSGVVGDVFRRAFALDYKMRYQNCEEFGRALDMVALCFGCNVEKSISLGLKKTDFLGIDDEDAQTLKKFRGQDEIERKSAEYAQISKMDRESKVNLLKGSDEAIEKMKKIRVLLIVILIVCILILLSFVGFNVYRHCFA